MEYLLNGYIFVYYLQYNQQTTDFMQTIRTVKTRTPNRWVFTIFQENLDGLEVYSNKQLVHRWISEAGTVMLEVKGKPPKQITSYAQVCRLFEKWHDVRFMVLRSGEEPARYRIVRAPIISK